jgi:hypothetical protein
MPYENLSDPTKAIYSYNRGDKVVKADPYVVWRKINAACEDLKTTWGGLCDEWKRNVDERSSFTPEDREQNGPAVEQNSIAWNLIHGKICAVAYQAFGVAPLDEEGNGLNEDAVFATLTDFIEYREKKEPTADASPASSAPTVGPRAMSSPGSLGGRSHTRTGTP